MQILFIILISIHLFSCSTSEKEQYYWLKYAGGRGEMMQNQDFSAKADLDSMKNMKGLMALGPIEDLKGEITILDGEIYTSVVENDSAVFRKDSIVKAVFLAYGIAEQYKSVEVEEPIQSLKNVEIFVKAQALANGLDLEKSFPFSMEVEVSELDYHIMSKKEKGMHGHQQHQKAKRNFTMEGAKAKIVGVWANSQEEGIYTHNGSRIHLHFVNEQSLASGHVDDIKILKGSTLYIPAN